jgi:hypothetical protein
MHAGRLDRRITILRASALRNAFQSPEQLSQSSPIHSRFIGPRRKFDRAGHNT